MVPNSSQSAVACGNLALVSVVMTTLAFGFHDYYRHANIDIPAATLNVIRLAEICHVYWLPLFCVIMIVDAAIMFFLTSWPRSKRWPLSAFSQLFVFASLVLVAYVAVWLGNPIIWEVP